MRDEGIDEVKDEGGIEKDGRNEVGGREGRHGVGFLCWQLEAGHRAGVGRKTHRIARTQYSFPEVEPQKKARRDGKSLSTRQLERLMGAGGHQKVLPIWGWVVLRKQKKCRMDAVEVDARASKLLPERSIVSNGKYLISEPRFQLDV